MLVFIVKRLLWMLPFLVAISFLSFVLIQLPPGDYVTTYIATLAASNEVVDQNAAADLRNRFGLDQPMVVQYWKWISNIAFRGDFGLSFEWQQPVGDLIWERMALTLLLTLSALLLTWGIALPVGVFSAVKKYSIADYIVTGLSFLGLAIPSFLLALVLMYVAAVHFGQNVGGLFSEQYLTAPWSVDKTIDLLQHLWIPVIILAVSGTASSASNGVHAYADAGVPSAASIHTGASFTASSTRLMAPAPDQAQPCTSSWRPHVAPSCGVVIIDFTRARRTGSMVPSTSYT